jgi:hypothetical protein
MAPNARPRSQQPERLMRYRFDNAAQARRHLHTVEGRQILFFPDPFLDVRDGQAVLLELSFTDSEQTLAVRGEVHSLETGSLRGAWVELYALRLIDGMQIACGTPRRLHRRLPADLMVRAERPGVPGSLARLADISAGGARVVAGGGKWSAGEEILISEITGGPPLRGHVIRAREGEIVLRFQRTDATTRRNALRLVEAAVQRWSNARETHHPGACACMRGGALFEPLLPRAAHRRVEGM